MIRLSSSNTPNKTKKQTNTKKIKEKKEKKREKEKKKQISLNSQSSFNENTDALSIKKIKPNHKIWQALHLWNLADESRGERPWNLNYENLVALV